MRMDEEEKKDLLDRIDRELGNKNDDTTEKGNQYSQQDDDDKNTRNYHPPDSPVRRVYENGVELNSGAGEM